MVRDRCLLSTSSRSSKAAETYHQQMRYTRSHRCNSVQFQYVAEDTNTKYVKHNVLQNISATLFVHLTTICVHFQKVPKKRTAKLQNVAKHLFDHPQKRCFIFNLQRLRSPVAHKPHLPHLPHLSHLSFDSAASATAATTRAARTCASMDGSPLRMMILR